MTDPTDPTRPAAGAVAREEVEEARRRLVAAVGRLFGSGVMSASGHGNISVRVPGSSDLLAVNAGDLVRPGGDVLGPRVVAEDIVVVDLDGRVRLGTPTPSVAAILKMHVGAYLARPELGSVIHTHSPSATGYALAGRSIPAHYEALLVHGQPVDVPVAPWAARGTAEAVRSIADTFAAHPDSYAVLLGNHGLLVGGDDAHHASGLAVAIEEAAVSGVAAASLGGSVPFPPGVADVDLRIHGI